MWAQGDSRCPFIRIGKCSKGIHGDFKLRIGSEVHRTPVCAGCEEERLREDGWVDVQMEKERESVVDEDEDDGWLMVVE
jgi:hypothetical protein